MRYTDLIRVNFVDLNFDVIRSLANAFKNDGGKCKFVYGNIFNFGSGTLVSPANSFGDMGGGIDNVYSEIFPSIEGRLRTFIKENHSGKLDIGTAQLVPTYDKKFPYILFSPTIVNVGDPALEENVYLAAKAVFRSALEYNRDTNLFPKLDTLLIPGLGTGSGNLDPMLSARSVYRAYREESGRL